MKFYIILLLLICKNYTYGQNNICGKTSYKNQELGKPELIKERELIEKHTNEYIKKLNLSKQLSATITIPVVVHVLWNTSTDNISDQQILSQIDILNQDFSMSNTDNTTVQGASFINVKANAEIQFCLAKQDPLGNPTSGIIRKETNKTEFPISNPQFPMQNSKGGDNIWNRENYLNIWVVPKIVDYNYPNATVNGYAVFPSDATFSYDGIVIDNKAFGNIGTATSNTSRNKGRTTTHEIGHYLNLTHIWGDDINSCFGTDDVADTPNQNSFTTGCPNFPKTDNCTNTGDGIMFMNFMDYSDDNCRVMFTLGQKNRMRAVLAPGGVRASLSSSIACNIPICPIPIGLNVSNINSGSVLMNWTEIPNVGSYTLEYKKSTDASYTSVSVTTNSYSLIGLLANTQYNVRIKSNCSATFSSSYSSILTFTTLDCQIPTVYSPAPSQLTATTATVSWNAVSGSTSYTLEYKVDNVFTYTVIPNITNTSYTITGLTANELYSFRVNTNCGTSSTSDYSVSGIFTTQPCAVIFDPTFTVSRCREGSNLKLFLTANQNNINNNWEIYKGSSMTNLGILMASSYTTNSDGNTISLTVPYGSAYVIKHGNYGGTCNLHLSESPQLLPHLSIAALNGSFDVFTHSLVGNIYKAETKFDYSAPIGTHNYTLFKKENGIWVTKDYKSSTVAPYTVTFDGIIADNPAPAPPQPIPPLTQYKIVHTVTSYVNGQCSKSKEEEVVFGKRIGSSQVIIASASCPTKLTAKAYLENVNDQTGLMDDYLRTEANFPLVSPYETEGIFPRVSDLPTTVTTQNVIDAAGDDAIVDWVFLELREDGENDDTPVSFTRSALLQKDGDIVDMDGISPVAFPNTPSGGLYYVAVRHRNHLGFRTENLTTISCSTALNFTNNSIAIHGFTPLKNIPNTNVWCMNGGDANHDGSIDANDDAIWNIQNGLFDDYSKNADYNMDGSVDSLDTIIWEWNNGKYEELDY